MATKAESFAQLQDILQNAWVDIQKYNAAKASWASSEEALKAGWYTWTTTNTWTTKTNTATQTSSWMNAVSQTSLNNNYNNAKVWTWSVAWINQQQTQTIQPQSDNIGKAWEWLDYETQQKKLNTINWLKEWLASKWITSKTQPTTQTTTTTPAKTTTTTKQTTPQQDRWDYQDNSQARMDQIADNLDKYRQTQPWLFEDASAFYNFFIDWKGRSQDQIDYLWDYFNRVQKFWKYDNLPASTIWDMLANWKLWDDYLNYLKTTDPAKYQEALSYRQDAEDTIKYESFLSDTADQAGLSWFEKFYKWIFGYRDENDDKIDDSLYIAPTEEEQTKQNRVNTIDSRIMEIKNMQKNLLDDLVEQYPWVPKATLMWIVQDRTKDLQREYDDLMVERTWLVWNIEYMQNERNAQMDARQQTINNLKTAYGMYYDFTPEWMAEYAQAKYAATNVTLDQAEKGNDTQKQMALESVLDWYYAKYWDIIQRSEAQVINDVMAYAKNNWVSLSQALQENFVNQLKKKPEYQAMQAALSEPNLQVIWYNYDGKAVYGYWDSDTKTFKPVTVWAGGISTWTGWEWASYTTDVQTLNNFIANLENKYTIASEWWTWGSKIRWWWCWTVVNDYLADIWDNIKLAEANDIKKYATSKTPAVWAVAYFDWTQSRATPATKEHWHVAIVVWEDWDKIKVLESNEWTWLRYKTYNKSSVTGYYIPEWIKTTEYNQKEYNDAFTKAGNIVASWIEWQGNKQMFNEVLQWLLDEWDYSWAFEYITVTWKNNAKWDAKDKIQAAETAMVDLISIRDALDAYYAAWWDTWILQWSLEKVANKLWKTTDPKLVWLATKISEAIQSYRKNISWTAFSEKEAKEYEALFPTISAWQEYNNAKLTSTLDSMVIRLNQLYGWLIWPRTYINVLDAHEKATWNRYSMYEEQSQLYNYLLNNWYLNPDGTVKTADDFASYLQSRQSQRKGKRF